MIAMAVYDTDENKRTDFTRRTIESILATVDLSLHRVIVVDNSSCEATKKVLIEFSAYAGVSLITLPENIGTARAINRAWQLRHDGENCVKMDNDVVIHQKNWLEDMEFCIEKQPEIGIIGLKRKDLMEYPDHPDPLFKSQLLMIPHQRGERWMVVEAVGHVIGTCQMYSSALLDKIGYLYQPGKYGFDDVLAAYRSHAVGMWNVFLPHIEIDHIDPGGDAYTVEKSDSVKPYIREVHVRGQEYASGTRGVWENP